MSTKTIANPPYQECNKSTRCSPSGGITQTTISNTNYKQLHIYNIMLHLHYNNDH